MPDLDPLLQVKLQKWRDSVRVAEANGMPAAELDAFRKQSLRVMVRTDLDDATLAGLGMTVSSRIGPLVLGSVAFADAERLARAPGVTAVEPERPMKAELDGSVPQIKAPAVWGGTPGFKGRNVIVGIIDSGIDIFHDSFRQADRSKTRILRIWDQRAPGTTGPFGYGVEYVSTQIEAALAVDVASPGTATFPHRDGSTGAGGVFEETEGHGTHCAGIAAGDGSPIDTCDFPFTFVGVAPEADLIIVAARGGTNSRLEALQYIFDHATTIAKAAVVNMSWGWNLGAHDGTDAMETGIDALLRDAASVPRPGKVVVKSAGNEGDAGRHSRKTIAANGNARFDFDIRAFPSFPNDLNSDEFDVWFDGAATLALTITGPPAAGVVSQVIPAIPANPYTISGINVRVSSAVLKPNGQKHIHIELTATPAVAATPTTPAVPAVPVTKGRWSFQFTETGGQPATIDIWADREDTDVYPIFVDAVRDNTISIPGNSQSVITVGSYDPDRFLGIGNFDLSEFSSWGLPLSQTPAGRRLKPDLCAPGQKIMAANSGRARKGPPCCACCNYLHVNMQGTSMAAPHVTGAVALMLEKNKTLTFEQVRTALQYGASREDIPSADFPDLLPAVNGGGTIGTPGQPGFHEIRQNHKWGSGRLDVAAAMTMVAAPAGGGGGGGTIDGADPEPESFLPRVGSPKWHEQLARHPAYQLIAALVSTHADEVRRLIDGNKRVAAVWRRNGGATILRHILQRPPEALMILPAAVGEFSSSTLVERLLRVFARFGSDQLRADAARWRDFVLAAPGRDLDELDARLRETAR
jgi:subtilisin family serine protease